MSSSSQSTTERMVWDGETHEAEADPRVARAAPQALRALFETNYAKIWRLLRRLGVREAHVPDVAQEVFWVAARRLAEIEPGREHAFLYGVALRLARNELRREYAGLPLAPVEALPELIDPQPTPEQ